ncbi:MAG TPA: alpha/beta hydrolase-fold protein [Verrucomicrobiae bacterium]|nr:alpha/beta hydrolase-fold protein [Verrucomicrobiae bacterium]
MRFGWRFLMVMMMAAHLAWGDSAIQAPRITFKVMAQNAPAGSKLFIVGSDEKLGGWNPGAVALEKQDDGSWTGTYSFPAGSQLEYKITRGNWETEAVSADGSVPGNYTLNVQSNETVTIVVANWRDILHKDIVRKVEGQITGVVKYHRQMEGEGIKPRDVIVWLPPSYEKSPEKHYPVLYVHDGQNIFDPATSFTGVDWQIDETADRLIREGKLQEILVVGIYNTADRGMEYSNTPTGRAYMRFVVEKLKPFIDKEYRTLPDREHTAVMGSSMGGLISFLMVWNYPQVFSRAACLSPAFVYREINAPSLVENYTGANKKIRIYIDGGGVGLDAQLQPGCDAMLRALQANGFKMGGNLEWYRDPEAEHNERAWSKRVWRPLLFMYGK